MDVRAWLEDLDLGQYAEAFASNEIDVAVLRTLTPHDLRELGVVPLGHRKKLLGAIAALDAASDAEPVSGEECKTIKEKTLQSICMALGQQEYKKRRYDLWDFFSKRADEINDHLWTNGTWLIALQTSLFAYVVSQKAVLIGDNEFMVRNNVLAWSAGYLGILLGIVSMLIISHHILHIKRNWRRVAVILERDAACGTKMEIGKKLIVGNVTFRMLIAISTILILPYIHIFCVFYPSFPVCWLVQYSPLSFSAEQPAAPLLQQSTNATWGNAVVSSGAEPTKKLRACHSTTAIANQEGSSAAKFFVEPEV